MSRNIINDGYTRTGHIAPADGLHAGLSFQYRPMLPEEAAVFIGERFDSQPPARRFAVAASAIAEKLQAWSEVDALGKPVPVTSEHVRRLPWILFNRVLNIVAGFGSSDPERPGKTENTEEEDENLSRWLRAARTGEAPGLITEREDRKN